ncbi:Rha family transcriptional regulator [Psychrobacter faecalis]|uniref:Rha family transcriptional regulator n=1 Tax=Psychrobacter faecalis TaxID=180588 RepID=A0ABT9HJF6_9GAMM|nr:Rha family transcriptional regulator [Psychrobacter faecalis]MDP4545863.1 Rha family transcriptional regulator [Psychrobacter faecalis]
MNILTQTNIKTMSSREMADLCDKQHKNVLSMIRSLIDGGVLKNSIPQTYVHEQNGQRYTEFLSDKRDSLVIVARLSPEFTAAVIDRWQELEQQAQQPQIPQSFAEALQLAADQAKQLELAAPKVAHYDKVVDRHTLLTATQVGQKIGLSAIMLNRVLSEIGVYNMAHKRGKAFKQWFVDKGLGEMKQTDMGHSQALFSLKGEAWVIERLASESVA